MKDGSTESLNIANSTVTKGNLTLERVLESNRNNYNPSQESRLQNIQVQNGKTRRSRAHSEISSRVYNRTNRPFPAIIGTRLFSATIRKPVLGITTRNPADPGLNPRDSKSLSNNRTATSRPYSKKRPIPGSNKRKAHSRPYNKKCPIPGSNNRNANSRHYNKNAQIQAVIKGTDKASCQMEIP